MEKRIIGDYALLFKLGEGTLGETYLAEHRFIKKQFVVKILPPELSEQSDFIARFESLIATLSSIDHPSIVKVHNVSYSDGVYFIVSDYIAGQRGESENLSSYLRHSKRNLPEDEVLDFLEHVASALSAIHQKKVQGHPLTHRNIKLSNILVREVDGRARPSLSDSGLPHIVGEAQILTSMYKHLAELVGVESGVMQSISADKHLFFTGDFDPNTLSKLHFSFYQNYAFLAPEQRFYRHAQHSIQADVYAFGVLAYFLIMRSFPEGYFPLPSEIRSDFTLDWDLFFKHTLQPSPAKRPSSVMEALDSVKRSRGNVTNYVHMSGEDDHYASSPRRERSPNSEYGYRSPAVKNQADFFDTGKEPDPLHPPLKRGGGYMGARSSYDEIGATESVAIKAAPVIHTEVSRMVQQEQSKPQPVLKPREIIRPTYEPDPGKVFQIETGVAPYRPEEKKIKDIEPLLTDMIIIKGGEYARGSEGGVRDERPRHKIWLSDFAVDIHSVTNEQFKRFLDLMGGEKDSNNNDIIKLRDSRLKRVGGEYTIEAGYSKHPVIGVTWYGASAYAKWVGKRLPSEAEYEIASRGGLVDALFPTGNDIDRSQANFFSSDTTPVMSFPPNGYGLYDTVGNVYEWCEDWYAYDYYEESLQEPENPKGPQQGVYRVLRGGCWRSLKEDLRCSHRHRNNPATVNGTYGFRCAADVVR